MDLSKLEDLLSISLYKTSKSSLERISAGSEEMRNKVDVEFNNFLRQVRKKIGRIYNYINCNDVIEPMVIRSNTTNFIFTYTIFPNKRSHIEITTLQKYGRDYPPDFLLSKTKNSTGYVYFLKSQYGYKIGCTYRLNERMNVFAVKLPFKVDPHSYVEAKNYNQLESKLHNLLSHKRINGEWFSIEDSDFIEIDLILNNMGLTRKPY